MKSFRVGKRRKSGMTQMVLIAILILTSILLTKYLPNDKKGGYSHQKNTQWESSVVTLP